MSFKSQPLLKLKRKRQIGRKEYKNRVNEKNKKRKRK